jgi:hypothetical protein
MESPSGSTSPSLMERRRSSGGSSVLQRLDLSQTAAIDGTEDWREESLSQACLDALFEAHTALPPAPPSPAPPAALETPALLVVSAATNIATCTPQPRPLSAAAEQALAGAAAAAAAASSRRPPLKRCSLSSLNSLNLSLASRKAPRSHRHLSSSTVLALLDHHRARAGLFS